MWEKGNFSGGYIISLIYCFGSSSSFQSFYRSTILFYLQCFTKPIEWFFWRIHAVFLGDEHVG